MIAGFVLIVAIAAYRLLPVLLHLKVQQPEWLLNFSPMAAMCLCGAACLPRRWAVTLPFVALLGTDIALNAHYGFALFTVEFAGKTIAFAAIAAFGWQFRKQPQARALLPAAFASSLFFYLVTNTASWLYEKDYAKTAGGWLQSLTTGLPGYAPTWLFYRNTLISDMVFTVLFLVCLNWRREPAPISEAQPVGASR